MGFGDDVRWLVVRLLPGAVVTGIYTGALMFLYASSSVGLQSRGVSAGWAYVGIVVVMACPPVVLWLDDRARSTT